MKRLFIVLIILILIMAGLWFWSVKQAPVTTTPPPPTPTTTTQQATTVSYACAAGKTITATLYQGELQPGTMGNPPIPGGSAHVILSDGRTFDLKQTLSADGVRYSNGNPSVKSGQPGAETFVFWSKGNGALVLENNQEKSYIGCVQTSADTGALPKIYTDPAGKFSIRLPQDYGVVVGYKYEQLGPGKAINGVKFTIPKALSTGTNLGSDSYISVEQIPNTTSCSADKFLLVNTENHTSSTPQEVTDNKVTYSYLTSLGAAAGNRYEESVYALPGTNPCVAVRYFVHYGAIENYPTGAVKQFDAASLKQTFDAIRRSLIVNQ